MKSTVKSFSHKLWRAFVLFAAVIFAMLWLLQTVLLQTCYTGMAVSGLKRNASKIAARKDAEGFFAAMEETAQENSLLLFLTDPSGEVLYSVDAYSSLYTANPYGGEASHSGGNPYFSDEASLSWKKGAVRNLPYSHMELIQQLYHSEARDLGYPAADGSAYIYGIKLGSCAALSHDNVILCISMPLGSVAGTARILRVQLLWVSLLSLTLAFILAYFLSRKFEKPIQGILAQARDIAQGNFHTAAHKGFCAELDNLSDALNETAASLTRLERSRQELLANISHDLRTPLTMIKGYAEMVQTISWNDAQKRNQDLDVIIRETDRLSALVNEILDYSSMQTLGRKPAMEAFSLSGAVTDAIRQFDALCSEQGYSIGQAIDPDIWILGNQPQIQRVIYNFIDNAVNHTDASRRIAVSLHSCGGMARLEVKDYGPGIPEADAPYIWDRYYTSRNRKNQAAVSGLGLSIAKEILTLHEAQFGVTCEEGCVFWFELPQALIPESD